MGDAALLLHSIPPRFYCMKKKIGICGANPFIVMFIKSDSIENVAQTVEHAFLG